MTVALPPDLVVVTVALHRSRGQRPLPAFPDGEPGILMTTSDETDGLDHPTLRRLVDEADGLPLLERRVLLKGLIPGFARDMSPIEFESFMHELRLKGARFYDATLHPGKGRAHRHVMGDRDLEGR